MAEPEKRTAAGIPYRIIRTKRRSMALQVDENGAVIIRAPLLMPGTEADRFVAEKKKWISEKQREILNAGGFRNIQVVNGGSFPYLGAELTICVGKVPVPICWRKWLILPESQQLRNVFQKWRKEQAALLLLPRVKYYCHRMGLYPVEIKWNEAATSWGSMSRTGTMKLNAALLHYTQREVDYIIVHELCHMRHMDHSAAFYQEVEQWIPDAKQIQKELRKKGIPTLK